MRINRELIQKFTLETVDRRTQSGSDILAAFLCGSFLGDNYALGGAADVDLFFVHVDPSGQKHEVLRITEDIHLDVIHHCQQDYRDPRHLRVHPWLGPSLNACKVLYDPQHFLDFIQASVRGQFNRPDHVFQRAQAQAGKAREIWFKLQSTPTVGSPSDVSEYLSAVENAANAIASLVGPPLPERRLLLEFPARAEALGRPGLFHGLAGLLGSPNLEQESFESWFSSWTAAYRSIPAGDVPVKFHPYRLKYYLSAFEEFARGEQPAFLLWPLISTWTQLASLYAEHSEHRTNWIRAIGTLGLTGAGLDDRVMALDSYLDLVEETLETWARQNGAWEG